MRFSALVAAMRVLVVFVVHVAVFVVHGLVLMLVLVPLGQDEPRADRSQR